MTTKQPSESLLFNTARQIGNPDERARYLADACGEDTGLRERVEKLLVALDAESQFLEQPAEGLQPTVVLADHHPSVLRQLGNTLDEVPRISLVEPSSADADPVLKPASPEIPKSQPDSRYRLDGEIARGGMGAVLKGRDTDLGRDLAIKVLLDAHRNNPQVIQRFIEEAQIGGQLQHPGIAPVYELGRFADDRPFFSMKLVKGETLSKLLSQRKDSSHDRARFLGIFEQVCQTVAYAHSRNVIHRDLKPANIMVGAFGEVQVMDWGLAKVLASGGVADERKARDSQQTMSIVQTMRSLGSDAPASFGSVGSAGSETQMGSVMGTPAYMPPEQALGEIDQLDQRSDVFGLGAILAEILTGKPPYVGEDGTQVFRMASRGKLDDCFTRLDTCGADAELVQLTKDCLELEPADRPDHAGVVAERISRYQESVETKLRETEIQRAAEAARADAEALQAVAERQRAEAEAARACEERQRRRTSLALAASIFLLVGLAAGGWAWITNERNQRIARLTSEANQALNQATVLSEQAKAASRIDFQLFASAREQLQRANVCIDNGLTDTTLIQRVRKLESELAEVEKDRVFLEELEEAWEATTNFDIRADAWGINAKRMFLSAFRNYGVPIGESDSEWAAKRFSDSSDQIKEAVSSALFYFLADAVELVEFRTDGKRTPGFAAEQTDDGNSKNLTWIRNIVAAIESEDSFNSRFVGLYDVTAGELRNVNKIDSALIDSSAMIDEIQINPYQATTLARFLPTSQAIELLQKAQWRYPDDFYVNSNLAYRMLEATPPQHEEAIRYYTSAVALNGKSPGAHHNLAAALLEAERYEESLFYSRRAIGLGMTSSGVYQNLSIAHLKLGNIPLAIASCEEGIAKNPGEASSHLNLGAIYCDYMCEYDQAIECFERCLSVDPQMEDGYLNIAKALIKKGEARNSIKRLEGAINRGLKTSRIYYQIALSQKELGESEAANSSFGQVIDLEPTYVDAYIERGRLLCHDIGDYSSAITCLQKALEIDQNCVPAHFYLGAALAMSGRVEEGVAAYRKYFDLDPSNAERFALAANVLYRCGQGNNSASSQVPLAEQAVKWGRRATELEPRNPTCIQALATALLGSRRFTEAIELLQTAIENGVQTSDIYAFLAGSQIEIGELDAAISSLDKSISLDPKNKNAYLMQAKLFIGSHDYAAAAKNFQQLIEFDPNDAASHNRLGYALWNTGDWDGALASYRKALELDPQNAYSHYSAAWMLANKADADGQFPQAEQAVVWARRATELESHNADYQNTLGLALYRTERWQDACEVLLKSIELGKDGPYNWLFLALANWQLEQKDKAQEWYQKSLAWKADHTEELAEDGELQGIFIEAEQLFQPATKDQPAESVNSDSTNK